METLLNIVQGILGIGATVILPIMITLLGLLFKMNLSKALKAGLTVGIGFAGLGLVVGLLNTTISPAVEYYRGLGEGFTTVDVGWPAVGGASWAAPFAALSVPLGIALNLILIRLKLTKTMNVDIWNYIHFLIPGAMAYYLTNNFWLGLGIVLLFSVLTLFLADWVRKPWQEYFGLEGTTCSTFSFLAFNYPIAWLVNKIIDFIPGLNKVDVSVEKINEKIGTWGDPIIIGLLVGILLGVITRQPYGTVLQMGVGISAVMLLMPKMVGVLMDGLTPISMQIQRTLRERIGEDSDIVIGMDVALGLGDSAVITSTVIGIPIVIALAFILPGLTYFPVGLLMSVCYMCVFAVLGSKGNLVRSLITFTITIAIVMLTANAVAPSATVMMRGAGMTLPGLGTDGMMGYPWSYLIHILFGG